MLSKLQSILDNVTHPLYDTLAQQMTFSRRLLSPRCTTERHRKSFLPVVIKLYKASLRESDTPLSVTRLKHGQSFLFCTSYTLFNCIFDLLCMYVYVYVYIWLYIFFIFIHIYVYIYIYILLLIDVAYITYNICYLYIWSCNKHNFPLGLLKYFWFWFSCVKNFKSKRERF